MRNSTNVTVTGWVASEPKLITTESGTEFVTFRVGSTPRYYARAEEQWVDGKTEWFTVKAWRETARNVALSIRKSNPVLVHGRLVTSEWESESGPRTDVVIEAFAVGHDLAHGTSVFQRSGGSSQLNSGASGANSEPEGSREVSDLGVEMQQASPVADLGLTAEPVPA